MSLGAGTSSPNFNPGDQKAVVISLARANDRGHTTVVFCLAERGMRDPFRLRNQDNWYIWSNQELREKGIGVGSIIFYKRFYRRCLYSGNTGKEVEVSEVISQLPFGRIYRGIKDAFPEAEVADIGVHQESRPRPPYALISISKAVALDGRLIFVTRLDEEVNLSNRSLRHASTSIEPVPLPTQTPTSEQDVGDVVLVGFGSEATPFGRFQAMCEGIILKPVQGAPTLESYAMSRVPRGLCVIINNLEFHKESMNRHGAVFYEQMFCDLFSELSFEVIVKNDLKYNEILDTAEEYASRDHSNYDAFVMIVMSHGADGDAICGVSGKRTVSVKDLMAEFTVNRCPSLARKPKVFIFQACRGSLDEREAPISDNNGYMADAMASDSTLALSVTPPGVDFLLAFATTPGYVSWLRQESGSPYIQALVSVIKEYHQHYHLLDMLTEVNKRVAESVGNEPGGRQQIPAPVHTLRAQLYLKDL